MLIKIFQIIHILLIVLLFVTCTNNDEYIKRGKVKYIHLSHFKMKPTPFINPKISNIKLNEYDVVMLGGDLADSTTKNIESMEYLDSIFDFGNENTLWSVGNHDFAGDTSLIQTFTKRKHYYAYFKNGIFFLVLDSQKDFSNIVGEQLEFFNSVMDTIQKTKHLIVLNHKLIWMYNNPTFSTDSINKISNGNFGECVFCLNPNNFYEDIYPKLQKAKQQGINVICIGGDIGIKVKEFEHYSKEGIIFLASGIEDNDSTNKILVFEHNLDSNLLKWEFKALKDF